MKYLIFFLVPFPILANTKIDGRWSTECHKFGKNNRHSFIASIHSVDTQFKLKFEMYEKQKCKKHVLTAFFAGSYEISDGYGEGLKFDGVPEKVTMTIFDRKVTEIYNKNAGCGIRDWVTGEERNVAGRFCRPFQMPAIDRVFYDIVGFGGETLRFGGVPLVWSKDTPSERPETLSSVRFFRIRRLTL